MLSDKEKRAVENLLILASYIKENSIYSGEQAKIIDEAIKTAETMIGKRLVEGKSELIGKHSTDVILKAIKDKFNP